MTRASKGESRTRHATLVVGGSGLIGRAIQDLTATRASKDSFSFTFAKNRGGIREGRRAVKLDLLDDSGKEVLTRFTKAIYVAGSSDHQLARTDPRADLNRNLVSFLRFMESFRGDLVLLSSQAVYYGLTGMVGERTQHIAEVPYGLSKQMTEEYAKYFLRIGRLRNLWIVRLMYAFGSGERSSRIIPSCARAAATGGTLELRGGGTSFVNPLPSSFVADVLVHAISAQQSSRGALVVTNLNHPEKVRVIDVVNFLQGIDPFDYSVTSAGEDWPVRFWGDTSAISGCLAEWKMRWPEVWREIEIYFKQIVRTEARS